MKKTKFWRRNRSFTFTPEVKVYPLIDSPMMLCNQPRRLSRDSNWPTQLISHHASIFLGVIILGMNKPRPWKCPWTSSKKRKKRTKNENTTMNEQEKVDGKLKLRLSGIKPAKDRVESFNWQRRFKGKLRSRNILPYMKAHIPSISKIVVIWCSTDLNLSSGTLKSLKITTLEHQRPPSWTWEWYRGYDVVTLVKGWFSQLICGV